jgi:hypothetical protein
MPISRSKMLKLSRRDPTLKLTLDMGMRGIMGRKRSRLDFD